MSEYTVVFHTVVADEYRIEAETEEQARAEALRLVSKRAPSTTQYNASDPAIVQVEQYDA